MLFDNRFFKGHIKTIALLIGGLLMVEVNSQNSEDENKMYLEIIEGMISEIKPSTGIVDEEMAGKSLPEAVPIEKINQGLRFFQQSFYYKESLFGNDKLELECDKAHVFYEDFVSVNVNWLTAKLTDGSNVLDPKTNDNQKEMVGLNRINTTITLSKPVPNDVVSVSGVIKVKYPTTVNTIELPINDFKTEKSVGNSKFRLLRVENDLAVIWSSAQSEDFSVYPVSADGIDLDKNHSCIGPYVVYKEFVDNKKLSKESRAKYIKNIDELKNGERIAAINATGKIAKLYISLPSDFKEQTLSIKANPRPDFSKDCPKISSPRFTVAKMKMNYVEVDAAKLQKETLIYSSRSNAAFGYNTPGIKFCLPKVANSFMAKLEVKNLSVTKGTASVAFEPQGPFGDGFSYSFRMDNDKPIDYTNVKGVLEIKYPAKVTTRTVNTGSGHPVVTFENCSVRVNGNSVEYEKRSPQPQVRAYDANGNELLVVQEFSLSGYSDDVEYNELRFWGTVSKVEFDIVEKWFSVSVPFDLKPAPRLPEL